MLVDIDEVLECTGGFAQVQEVFVVAMPEDLDLQLGGEEVKVGGGVGSTLGIAVAGQGQPGIRGSLN